MISKMRFTKKIGFLALMGSLAACQTWRDRTTAAAPVDTATARATAQAGGHEFTEISFKEGSDELTSASREKLRNLTEEAAKQGKKVDEIKILSWADVDYPSDKTKAPKKEINLAKDRARKIESYLKDDLKAEADVDTYNMAQRPYKISEIFQTEDYKMKSTFEKSGVIPGEGSAVSRKASKAVIFVKYE